MLLSLITRRLRAYIPHQRLIQLATRSYEKDCPKTKACKMEYPQKKTQEMNCGKETKEMIGKNAQDPCCDDERLGRDPCHQKRAQHEKKDLQLIQRVLPLKSVWEYPAECCGNPCPEMLPRFDFIYYRVSDKEKREYQQTWLECPELQVSKRKICCIDPNELPPICRRSKSERPGTACEMDAIKMKALCSLSKTKKCPRVQLPCCRTSRAPPICKNPRSPTDCRKRCCPYPSFSECCHDCPPPKRAKECLCLERPPRCVTYSYLRRKILHNLPPPLPAWPPK